jgi:putative oxidoreductase
MTVSRLIARPMLASTFLLGGVNALRNAPALGAKAGPVTEKVVPRLRQAAPSVPIPSDPVTLVRINAVAQIAAAAALATGRAPRLAATVLAASLVPTTLAGHSFWEYTDKEERKQLQFFKNLSMLGGLVIAAGDTEGKPGVAWRARRAARDARREAGYLAGTARREVKLAAAQLG